MSQIKVDSIVPRGGLSSGASGGVIQTIQSKITGVGSISFSSANTYLTLPGDFSATLTPQSASSKILIMAMVNGEFSHLDTLYKSQLAFKRNGTEIWDGASHGDRHYGYGSFTDNYQNDGSNTMETKDLLYLDSPNTTSAVTIQLGIRMGQDSGGTFYYNRNVGTSDNGAYGRCVSTLILQEITP